MKSLKERSVKVHGHKVFTEKAVRACVELAKQVKYSFVDHHFVCEKCKKKGKRMLSKNRYWCRDCEWEHWVGV